MRQIPDQYDTTYEYTGEWREDEDYNPRHRLPEGINLLLGERLWWTRHLDLPSTLSESNRRLSHHGNSHTQTPAFDEISLGQHYTAFLCPVGELRPAR
jgi:hypothetical protein